MKHLKKWGYCLFVVVFIFAAITPMARADDPFPNCRLGVGGAYNPYAGDYDLAQLNTGLYSDWKTRSDPVSETGLAANIEYIQTIRVHQDKVGDWNSAYVDPPTYTVSPNLATLPNTVAASPPGSLWLIGNEIDRRDHSLGGQDEITPEVYATAFHEIREIIKTADSTARIGIGSVVQPTAMRLDYLDQIWDSYAVQGFGSLGDDVDVWNIHVHMLREVRYSWGSDIPPGPFNTNGFLSAFEDPAQRDQIVDVHHDMNYFQAFIEGNALLDPYVEGSAEVGIEGFREWMAARGEQHKPLLISEYGIIIATLGISDSEIENYLSNTFDYMLTATDPTIGFPADENRLIQGWVWYSMNDDFTFAHDSSLFNSTTQELRPLGQVWKNYVADTVNHPLAATPQRNLLVANLRTEPESYTEPGGPVPFKLLVDVANSGNISVTTPITVTFWDGDPDAGGTQIGSPQMINSLAGCGRFTTFEVNWPNRTDAVNTWYAKVETSATETKTNDNKASHTAYIYNPAPTAELAIAKSVDDNAPVEGFSKINYTIVVTNTGPDEAINVVAKDELPNGLTFVTYEATQGNYFSIGPWTIGNLAPGAVAKLTITAKVNEGQAGNTITNTATISSSDSINTSANDTDNVGIKPVEAGKVYIPVILKE